jgi:hypothetical protein
MIVIRVLVHAALRTVALALALLAYDFVYDLVVPPPPDADIGKGLLAFMMLSGIGLVWGIIDGLRTTPAVWLVGWVVSGAALALGWEVWLADGSTARMEQDAVVFIATLITGPALVGATLAWLSGRRSETQPAS